MPISFNCDYCGKEVIRSAGHFERVKNHYCSHSCHSNAKKYQIDVIDRFEEKIFYSPDGCWYWVGATLPEQGYGTFWNGYKVVKAHRFSYELYRAKIPKYKNPHDSSVLHTCDNRLCVNPDHLFLGTHYENMEDMVRKGRVKSKITEDQAREILSLYEEGIGPLAISKTMNIPHRCAKNVVYGTSFRRLTRSR